MDDIAAPNEVEHLMVDYREKERLQDLVDAECAESASVDMWPEHWQESGAVEVWKCPVCDRLYFYPKGRPEDIIVYRKEQVGLSDELPAI